MVCNNTVKPPCLTTSPLIKRPSSQNTKVLDISQTVLGDPGADGVSLNGQEKNGAEKSKGRFFRQFRPSLAPTICPWVSKEACKRPPFVSDRDKTATTFSGHFLISELAVCTTLLIVNEELAVKTRNCIYKNIFRKVCQGLYSKKFPCGSTLVSDKQILLVAYRRFNCSQYRGSCWLAFRPFVLIGYLLKANYQYHTQIKNVLKPSQNAS